MHENARQIQMHPETHNHIGVIDGCRWLPQNKTTILNLIQTGTLSNVLLFVLYGLFKLGSLLIEKTFPDGEIAALEQSVVQNGFYTVMYVR